MDWYPLYNSVRIAAVSTLVVYFLGIFLANVVARVPRLVKGALDVVLTLPLVLPPTVVGYLLLRVFGPKRVVGAWLLQALGVKLTMVWYAAILATVVVSFPLMYRTARGAFESFDESLADAARTLGRSERWIFWHVKMPYCQQGIVAGAVLAFARALGEYGATAINLRLHARLHRHRFHHGLPAVAHRRRRRRPGVGHGEPGHQRRGAAGHELVRAEEQGRRAPRRQALARERGGWGPMSLSVDIRRHLAGFDLDVSFEVADARETLALLGPSGCGKSMTLKCVAGIVTPDEGRIVLNDRVLFDSAAGVNLRPQERRVGYLFQSYALFPNMTVEQNVGVGVLGASREERAARVAEQVRAFRLDGLQKKRPAQLSGGQQQRVALARIMASKPELLLFDEPFSALDGYLRWQLELELTDTLREFPGGSVYVSHNTRRWATACATRSAWSPPAKASPSSPCVSSSLRPPRWRRPSSAAARTSAAPERLAKGQSLCRSSGLRGAGACGLEPRCPCRRGLSHVGVRAHYFRVVASGAGEKGAAPGAAQNLIPCEVDRVIDNTFSTIAMLQTPGGGLLRYGIRGRVGRRWASPTT